MSGTRRVTSYAYTSLSVSPSEQLSICLKMSLFHHHFTAVFTERAALGWQSFSFHAPSGWSHRLLVLLSVLKSAVSLIILGRWSIFCFWRLLSCFAVAICYAMAWFFFFFFCLERHWASWILIVLISFRKFSATLSRPHPVHFPFCSTSGPLLERAGPPHRVPRFLILCGCIPAFPCHTLCNSSWPILQFSNSLQLFLTCFQISLLLKFFPSSLWFSQTCWVSFCGFSFLTDIPSLSCSWKHSENCFIQCGMLCLLVCCHRFRKSLAAFPHTPSYLCPYAGHHIWELSVGITWSRG